MALELHDWLILALTLVVSSFWLLNRLEKRIASLNTHTATPTAPDADASPPGEDASPPDEDASPPVTPAVHVEGGLLHRERRWQASQWGTWHAHTRAVSNDVRLPLHGAHHNSRDAIWSRSFEEAPLTDARTACS